MTYEQTVTAIHEDLAGAVPLLEGFARQRIELATLLVARSNAFDVPIPAGTAMRARAIAAALEEGMSVKDLISQLQEMRAAFGTIEGLDEAAQAHGMGGDIFPDDIAHNVSHLVSSIIGRIRTRKAEGTASPDQLAALELLLRAFNAARSLDTTTAPTRVAVRQTVSEAISDAQISQIYTEGHTRDALVSMNKIIGLLA